MNPDSGFPVLLDISASGTRFCPGVSHIPAVGSQNSGLGNLSVDVWVCACLLGAALAMPGSLSFCGIGFSNATFFQDAHIVVTSTFLIFWSLLYCFTALTPLTV